jgi:glycosyltransferase involved in cell wall biosynthesis
MRVANGFYELAEVYKSFFSKIQAKPVAGLDGVTIRPKVSIVMPSYNQELFIERSLLSVINQGYANLELILIDGGSTDATLSIIKKYEEHVSYLVSEPDHGQSDALNKGFARATGDILGWLNSDDIYMPGAIELAVATLLKRLDKNIVFGDWLAIDENDNLLAYEYAFDMNINHTKYEGVSINAQAMFWRREVHERFGSFETTLYNTMDYQMVLAFGLNEGKRAFIRLPSVLGCFRRYEGQKTGGANFQRQMNEHRLLAERYGYSDKYTFLGKSKRYYYRLRRGYWYLRRAGVKYFIEKLLSSREINKYNWQVIGK